MSSRADPRERVFARLDAERPWWVLEFFEVGLVARVRAKTLGAALFRLGRGGFVVRVNEPPGRKLVDNVPPGRFTYRTEPFRRECAHTVLPPVLPPVPEKAD